MTRAPVHVEAAKRLLAHESTGSGADEPAALAVRVYEKLSLRLAPLIGAAGVQAVLARSAKLTRDEFPCLRELFVSAAQPKEQLHACLSKTEPAVASAAAAAMLGAFLGLLTAFIGEPLVWHVLRGTFPAIDLNVPEELKS